jgi:soluble lytic murein transglycosylase
VRYAAGDYGGAADAFGTLGGESNRRARLAGGYWQARALEQLGDDAEARRRLGTLAETSPDSYYGLLARARLEGRDAIPDEPPPAVPATLTVPPPFPDALEGAHAARARALQAAGLHRIARLELDAIGDAAPTPLLLQAYAAARAPGSALRLARTADAGPQWIYPLGFWDLVAPAAETRGLDPLFVTALIRQESLFFPDAVSPADAHGLMQLLPRTAREVAVSSGQPVPDVHALHEPDVNVALGTTLLRRLLDRYGGSRVRALAAYNAGEDAVAKWDRRFGDRPEDEYVERITYRETRDYVKSVLDHWAAYRGLYAASPAATSDGSPPKAPLDMMTMTSPGRTEPTR